MKAVIETGSKQYVVAEGDIVRVGKIEKPEQSIVTLNNVLMLLQDGDIKVDKELISKAFVEAEVVKNGREKKVICFKYKPKKGFHKTIGHRQDYTDLKIIKVGY